MPYNPKGRDKRMMKALRRDPDPASVARAFGVDESTVYRAIKRTGVSLDLLRAVSCRPPGTESACYHYLADNGVKPAEIARKFGVTVQHVSQELNKTKKVA